ncbi:hypothetical protein ACGF3C_11030 [Micromonospora sp. NPDC047762]|uniref:hypothetical protein n=1 Tax=Micromonospora sp. NPDC047762 TaxID=3364255 RepID=UPI00371C227A
MGATDPGIDDGEASGKTAVERKLSAGATASRLLMRIVRPEERSATARTLTELLNEVRALRG